MRFEKKDDKIAILVKKNIIVDCHAKDRNEAILAIGKLLRDSGYIKEGYIQGMLHREYNLTTYIGNDIAIPHGDYKVKDCVIKTGIAVMIYPEGISWSQDIVRIVIGIAAKNDEHLKIPVNIADKLCEMDIVEKVVMGNVDFIYDVLAGDGK